MPPDLLAPLLHYLHTTYRLPFWPKFSPPKVSTQQISDFSIHSLPPGAQNKEFSALALYIQTDVQMKMTAFRHSLPILNTHLPQQQCNYD